MEQAEEGQGVLWDRKPRDNTWALREKMLDRQVCYLLDSEVNFKLQRNRVFSALLL